jgi:prolyl 4-hydroxylase
VVYDKDFKSVVDRRYRTSQSAMMPHDDHVSQCLAKRMKSFLGNVQHIETEPIQVVKYEGGEKFSLHTDWLDEPINSTYSKKYPDRYYNRLGSIFAYLDGGCTGGETYFPLVKGVSAAADGDKFSRTETGEGLLVRPRRGSAVFWNNLHPRNASGDRRVLHAGIPVETGRKIGINLFSYYFLDAPFIGGEEE